MKSIFANLVLVGLVGNCLGQGIVDWNFINPAFMTAQTNNTQYYNDGLTGGGTVGNIATASSGVTYYFELLYNTQFTGSQISPPDYYDLFNGTWHDTGLTATNSNVAGRLAPVNPNAAAVVPWASGVTNNIMLFGWSSDWGTSWATVSNILATPIYGGFPTEGGFLGESATGYISPSAGPGPGPGASVFGNGPIYDGLPIYSLNTQLYITTLEDPGIIPEPSTFALASLGALSLFLFRRERR